MSHIKTKIAKTVEPFRGLKFTNVAPHSPLGSNHWLKSYCLISGNSCFFADGSTSPHSKSDFALIKATVRLTDKIEHIIAQIAYRVDVAAHSGGVEGIEAVDVTIVSGGENLHGLYKLHIEKSLAMLEYDYHRKECVYFYQEYINVLRDKVSETKRRWEEINDNEDSVADYRYDQYQKAQTELQMYQNSLDAEPPADKAYQCYGKTPEPIGAETVEPFFLEMTSLTEMTPLGLDHWLTSYHYLSGDSKFFADGSCSHESKSDFLMATATERTTGKVIYLVIQIAYKVHVIDDVGGVDNVTELDISILGPETELKGLYKLHIEKTLRRLPESLMSRFNLGKYRYESTEHLELMVKIAKREAEAVIGYDKPDKHWVINWRKENSVKAQQDLDDFRELLRAEHTREQTFLMRLCQKFEIDFHRYPCECSVTASFTRVQRALTKLHQIEKLLNAENDFERQLLEKIQIAREDLKTIVIESINSDIVNDREIHHKAFDILRRFEQALQEFILNRRHLYNSKDM